jgi:hypothetical protein
MSPVRRFWGYVARVKAAVRRTVFSQSVRPYIWLYYLPLWLWGLYVALFAAPVTYVQPVMGSWVYGVWAWMHLIAPSVVMFALHLEHKAEFDDTSDVLIIEDLRLHLDALSRVSIRMQTGGHASMFFVLLAYEISATYEAAWGLGACGPDIYSIFVIAPYVFGCLLLTVQGSAKIVVAERAVRRDEH